MGLFRKGYRLTCVGAHAGLLRAEGRGLTRGEGSSGLGFGRMPHDAWSSPEEREGWAVWSASSVGALGLCPRLSWGSPCGHQACTRCPESDAVSGQWAEITDQAEGQVTGPHPAAPRIKGL